MTVRRNTIKQSAAPPVVVSESGNGPFAQFVTIGHHAMRADEPTRLGGRDTGPAPYDFLLAGLGACTAMTLRMYASKHGWPVEGITVTLRHKKVAAAEQTGLIDQFERVIAISGALSQEQKEKLLEIANQCPVSRTLQRPSIVNSRVE